MSSANIKNLLQLAVHNDNHQCKIINLNNDQTRKWKRVMPSNLANLFQTKSTTNTISLTKVKDAHRRANITNLVHLTIRLGYHTCILTNLNKDQPQKWKRMTHSTPIWPPKCTTNMTLFIKHTFCTGFNGILAICAPGGSQ